MNYLLKLPLNLNPPDFCLLSSWDYRRDHWCLGCWTSLDLAQSLLEKREGERHMNTMETNPS
jgi:hypothetical protein